MRDFWLITLKESIEEYQGKKKAQFDNREERNAFKATRHLAKLLGYNDETVVYKFINKSTSKVKFGVEELTRICIEIENPAAIEDMLEEVKEAIQKKMDKRKEVLSNQLKLM